MKPKIGITSQYDNYQGSLKLSPFYADVIEASGGVPFILPYTRNLELLDSFANSLDGFVFSGGANIDPQKYGEATADNCGNIEFERDLFELSLCKKVTELNKPILGICRGCQLITVASGGTLHQHIEGHSQIEDKHITTHSVDIMQDTLLYDILKATKTDVNSFHYQTVKTTGELRVCAKDVQGSIEAVFMPGQKFHLGIQWHPERMYYTNIHAKLIFDRFIYSCF